MQQAVRDATAEAAAAIRPGATRPIRILFPFIDGPSMGGSHISALKLVAALDADRFTPIIVLHDLDGTGPGAIARHIADLGLRYETIDDLPIMAPTARRIANTASPLTFLTRTLPRMRRILKEKAIDIVHTNDGRMHVNWGIAARISGCRLLWHHREDPRSRGVNTLGPFLADRIATVSQFARPARPLLPVAKRTHVIHSPFEFPPSPDRDAARAELLDEIGAGEAPLLLGYFGALVPRKRPLDFVPWRRPRRRCPTAMSGGSCSAWRSSRTSRSTTTPRRLPRISGSATGST